MHRVLVVTLLSSLFALPQGQKHVTFEADGLGRIDVTSSFPVGGFPTANFRNSSGRILYSVPMGSPTPKFFGSNRDRLTIQLNGRILDLQRLCTSFWDRRLNNAPCLRLHSTREVRTASMFRPSFDRWMTIEVLAPARAARIFSRRLLCGGFRRAPWVRSGCVDRPLGGRRPLWKSSLQHSALSDRSSYRTSH